MIINFRVRIIHGIIAMNDNEANTIDVTDYIKIGTDKENSLFNQWKNDPVHDKTKKGQTSTNVVDDETDPESVEE